MVRHKSKPMMATMENRRLAAARVLAGLTQRELAERVGSREIEISRIETGRVRPAADVKRRIAEVLGRSLQGQALICQATWSPAKRTRLWVTPSDG